MPQRIGLDYVGTDNQRHNVVVMGRKAFAGQVAEDIRTRARW
ncbi:MAG: hypothetical protein OXR82_05875 [Gammaproteobacteria bacterium]|nr:hypothetical protein [Gammaproteobacteria bacterium]MDE0257901.1 hypothetical protein [Gammaproteobacteria bacterium]